MLTFRHITKRYGHYRGLSISLKSVDRLKDFVSIVNNDIRPFCMPLDDKVWIQYRQGMVKLYVASSKHENVDHRFFRFNSSEWNEFIRHILPEVTSFIKHGGCRAGGSGKSYADFKDNSNQSRGHRVSHSRKRHRPTCRQTDETSHSSAKRTTNDVDMEGNEEEEEEEIVDYPILS